MGDGERIITVLCYIYGHNVCSFSVYYYQAYGIGPQRIVSLFQSTLLTRMYVGYILVLSKPYQVVA